MHLTLANTGGCACLDGLAFEVVKGPVPCGWFVSDTPSGNCTVACPAGLLQCHFGSGIRCDADGTWHMNTGSLSCSHPDTAATFATCDPDILVIFDLTITIVTGNCCNGTVRATLTR